MPSPIIHTTAGYLIYRYSRRKLPAEARHALGPLSLLLAITVIFAMLPDFDALLGLVVGDIGRYHNQGTHSLVVGLAISLIVAACLCYRKKSSFLSWFLVLLIGYESHVVLDYFTNGGRGVMLFWPFSSERFLPPFTLFHGVRWSQGLYTTEHILTVASELLIVLVVFLAIWFFEGRKSRKTDLPVTATQWIDPSQSLSDDTTGIKR